MEGGSGGFTFTVGGGFLLFLMGRVWFWEFLLGVCIVRFLSVVCTFVAFELYLRGWIRVFGYLWVFSVIFVRFRLVNVRISSRVLNVF